MFVPDFIPYIFSQVEIKRIFTETNKLISQNNKRLTLKSFKVILSLLYGSGLRISEALNLKIEDVDFNTKKIKIRDSKNHKNRLIIVSNSVNQIIYEYVNSINYSSSTDFIFKNQNLSRAGYVKYRYTFNLILRLSDIPKRKNCQGPRFHDLRHTFAIHSLEKMIDEGYDIYTSLPLLSEYLGHKSIIETEYYLRFTKHSYDKFTNLTNLFYSEVFPKVVNDNEM